MGRGGQIYTEILKIIYIDTLLSKRWNITSHFLSVGSAQWLPSKKYSTEKGGKSNLIAEKLDKYYLRQVIKVNINNDKWWW